VDPFLFYLEMKWMNVYLEFFKNKKIKASDILFTFLISDR
jgi:hypothetical protein